jgi:acetyltransferase-like isoleucine patch superfamily enzyme
MKNQMDSVWLRQHYAQAHDVHVGLYSYGCFDVRRVPRGTQVGRYASFSQTCWFLNANHVQDFLSLHPYLYNPALGLVASEPFDRTRFVIEDDVWVGHNAIITAAAGRIGRGAVIAAGAVVTREVLPYEVVAGVPARRLHMRFTPECIERIEHSAWWQMPKADLAELIRQRSPMLFEPARHFGQPAATLQP